MLKGEEFYMTFNLTTLPILLCIGRKLSAISLRPATSVFITAGSKVLRCLDDILFDNPAIDKHKKITWIASFVPLIHQGCQQRWSKWQPRCREAWSGIRSRWSNSECLRESASPVWGQAFRQSHLHLFCFPALLIFCWRPWWAGDDCCQIERSWREHWVQRDHPDDGQSFESPHI